MKDYYGNISSPIWLIGDSPPEPTKKGDNPIKYLDHPLDQKHPAIHNIWTPIIYRMQKIYDKERDEKEKYKFIDFDEKLYIRNAVTITKNRLQPNGKEWKNKELNSQLIKMMKLIKNNDHHLLMIITFGQFSFEFIRRCLPYDCESKFKEHRPIYWNVERLGKCFRDAIKSEKRIIPLLHTSISINWEKTHRQFTDNAHGNYFDYVAKELYPRFIKICSQ